MREKSSAGAKRVRRSAKRVVVPREADLARLRRVATGPVDTSDIPERPNAALGARASSGRKLSAQQPGLLRQAIVKEMARQNLTPYALAKRARLFCQTLSEAAVYEFLKGARQVEVRYAEALLRALRLQVVPDRSRAVDPKSIGITRKSA